MTPLEKRNNGSKPTQAVPREQRPAEPAAANAGHVPPTRDDTLSTSASFTQRRIWSMEQLEPGTSRFNVGFTLRLKGGLEAGALTDALTALITRQDALRTRFQTDDGDKLTIIVMAPWSFDLPIVPLVHTASDAEAALSAEIQREANRPFLFNDEPLIRCMLYRLAEDEHLLQLTVHELVMDRWSTELLVSDLAEFYNAGLEGRSPVLSELPLHFSDYARWQNDLLAGPERERLLEYWTTQLKDSTSSLSLPVDGPRLPQQMFRGGHRRFIVPASLLADVNTCCEQQDTSPFNVLLTGVFAVLARYTGETDLVVRSTLAARARAETRRLVGCFADDVVLRGRLDGDPAFAELLQQVHRTTKDAVANGGLPFEMLLQSVDAPYDPGPSPLFQVMVSFEDEPATSANMTGIETCLDRVTTDSAGPDLALQFTLRGDTLSLDIEYDAEIFHAPSVDRLWEHLTGYLHRALQPPDTSVAAIPLLTDVERHQQLIEWNQTARDYPRNESLAGLLQAQVERTPNAIAVTYDAQHLTFRAWNEQANRLAHELLKHGAAPGQLIAVFLERDLDLIVALLAIVKTGAAYLPLDPLLPAERAAYMLHDSGAGVVLVGDETQAALPHFAGTVIPIHADAWSTNSVDNPAVHTTPEDLAYVIYTSGSTGRPKGVEIKQAALINFLWSMRDWLQLADSDRVLALTTISFDIAGLEIWLPPLVGAEIVLAGRAIAADGNLLQAVIKQHDITFMQATPVTWQLLFRSGWLGKADLQAICGGEAMPPGLAAKLLSATKRAWNMYGPTETTIWSTGQRLTGERESVSIGRPIANTQCYILDALLQPVPLGVTGSLYIAGDGLARGYRNRPDLTTQAFVDAPFGSQATTSNPVRMYRTGDLARYRPSGEIECLGRMDTQIKLRGYRIELSEIEAALIDLPAIEQAAVVLRDDPVAGPQLVACVVPSEGSALNLSEVQTQLRSTLPHYMLPSVYQSLPALPLSASGKIDRRALPLTTSPLAPQPSRYDAPRGPVEEALAHIWAEVLEVPRVGIHEDYFALGGDSLHAVRLILKIRDVFPDARPSLTTFLHAPTVAEFARSIRAGQVDWSYLVPVREGGERTPFFCVHGAGGNVLSMRDLAMALPEDQPFYCLQARGIDGVTPPFTSVEETAECYLQHIRTIQPHGPYHLGGGCYGGLIAFEMACRLRAAGETVGVLAVIDCQNRAQRARVSPAALLSRNARFFVRRIRHHLSILRRNQTTDRLLYAKRTVQIGLRLAVDAVLHVLGRPSLAPARNAAAYTEPQSLENELQATTDRVREASLTAARNYVPPIYDGRLWVFRAQQRADEPYADDALGWDPFVSGSIITQEIVADHMSIFHYPAVNVIANVIDDAIRQTD